MNDRVGGYKRSDLLYIPNNDGNVADDEAEEIEPTPVARTPGSRSEGIQENKIKNTIQRRLNTESVKPSNIKHNSRPRRNPDMGAVITTVYGRRRKK